MPRLILTLNAGSSNLKAALFETGGREPVEIGRTRIEGQAGETAVIGAALSWADEMAAGRELAAAGHRIVHGGAEFHAPQLLTSEIVEALERLVPLAPLHQPEGVGAIRAVTAARPALPQVACFDTAFHWTQPAVAQRIGIPRALHDKGVRRYGFHGLSYEHVVHSLRILDPALAAGRVVAAHLGSGASLCAIQGGQSVETTMGFSPLDGLLMATRPGQLDPGVVLYLLQQEGMTPGETEELLYRRSGLLGVSGLSADMRVLLDSDKAPAKEAIELYVYRAALQISALATAMGGLDGVVFTGGVGENSPEIRARIARRLAWLGLLLDQPANDDGRAKRIDAEASRLRAWVIPADEEATIARHVLETIAR